MTKPDAGETSERGEAVPELGGSPHSGGVSPNAMNTAPLILQSAQSQSRQNAEYTRDLNVELFRTREALNSTKLIVDEQAARLAELNRQLLELPEPRRGLSGLERHFAPLQGLAASPPPQVTLEDLRQEKAIWQAESNDIRDQADAAVQLLRSVLDSRSWRLTRPLRQLTELLRGRRWVEPSLQGPSWANERAASPRAPFDPTLDLLKCIAGIGFPTCETPKVSILIPAYGNLGVTAQCLRSISVNPPSVPYEVIVVEDCSGDPHIGVLAQVPGLRYQENSENLGFLLSCNRATDLVRGEFVCFLNNDTEVTEGSIDALLRIFEQFPACGMAGAKLVFPDGRLQEAGGIIWADGSGWNHGRGGDPATPEYNYVREVDYCSGAAILLRSEVFREVGRFDPRFAPAYYEDADLAFRLRERGLKVYYCPRAVVKHFEGLSHGTSAESGIKAYQVRNKKIFRQLWRHVLDRRHYRSEDCVFRAREHARHKRVVLVMDHTLPQPDRDAGSRAMLQTMVALTRMGLVVKFWPDDHGYNARYHHLLEDMGIEVVTGARWGGSFEEYLKEVGQQLDFAILSRPNFAVPYLAQLRDYSRAHVAFFGHDLHHRRMFAQARVTGDKSAHRGALEMEHLEKSLWKAADSVIYPSQEEADMVAEHVGAEKVHAVPLYCFQESELSLPQAGAGHVKIIFVAGFGHPPNEDAAEWLVTRIFPRILRALPGAILHLVGSNPTERVRALASDTVRISGNVSAAELESHYDSASVAIAPLRFGGGVKLKVVEAMARGVPMVTTSVGVQGLPAIEDCISVADDEDSLADAVVALAGDPQRSRKAALAAHSYLRQHYSEACMERALWRALTGSGELVTES